MIPSRKYCLPCMFFVKKTTPVNDSIKIKLSVLFNQVVTITFTL
jgi:hypothetical protein